MISWYILIGLSTCSGFSILGMTYYKRWQFAQGKMNISFHHVPIFHIHEYSLFLHKALSHFSRELLLNFAAKIYVWGRFAVGRFKGRINQTRFARRIKMLIDEIKGKQYFYMEGNKTSEFLRAIAEHKQKMRQNQQ